MPRIEKECHDTLLRAKKVRKEEIPKPNVEKIGIGLGAVGSGTPEGQGFGSQRFYPKERTNYYEDKGFYRGYKKQPFYKKGFGNEGFLKFNNGNIISISSNPMTNFNNNSNNKNNSNNNKNNNNNPFANKLQGFFRPNYSSFQTFSESLKLEPTSVLEEKILLKEETVNVRLEDNLVEMNKPASGLKSLIQNPISSMGLRDEIRESLLNQTEIEENERFSTKIEELLENKFEIPILEQGEKIPLDKNILMERKIKKKENSQKSLEQIVKKVHIE